MTDLVAWGLAGGAVVGMLLFAWLAYEVVTAPLVGPDHPWADEDVNSLVGLSRGSLPVYTQFRGGSRMDGPLLKNPDTYLTCPDYVPEEWQ